MQKAFLMTGRKIGDAEGLGGECALKLERRHTPVHVGMASLIITDAAVVETRTAPKVSGVSGCRLV